VLEGMINEFDVDVDFQAEAIPTLRALVADSDAQVRLAAIKALAALKDRECVPAMLEALASPDMIVQIEVIAALRSLGDTRAEPALIGLLRHENPYIRSASIQALGELGTRESLPALAALQLQDTGWISINNGFDQLSIKAAAATAAQAIRARLHRSE